MWYANDMFHYMFKAGFVTLVSPVGWWILMKLDLEGGVGRCFLTSFFRAANKRNKCVRLNKFKYFTTLDR